MRLISDRNGRNFYHVLEDLRHPILNASLGSKKEYLVLQDGVILYWHRYNNFYTIDALGKEISRLSIGKETWKDGDRRSTLCDYYNSVLRLMMSHKRTLTIDVVLEKEQNIDSLWLAC